MRRALLFCLLATIFLRTPVIAQAQQAKIPRIGYLNALFPTTNPARIEAFRQGLRELGYVEGKNIFIEYRFAEGKVDRLPALALDLVRLKVEVIVTSASQETRAAKDATNTIPIVMTNEGDPVGTGFVASLAQTRRKHHRIVNACTGVKRKTAGASERDPSKALPPCRPRQFDQPRQRAHVRRGGACRSGFES